MSEITEKHGIEFFREITGDEFWETTLFHPKIISDCKNKRINNMNKLGSELCHIMHATIHPSADRSAAIRSLRLAIMQANESIIHEKE